MFTASLTLCMLHVQGFKVKMTRCNSLYDVGGEIMAVATCCSVLRNERETKGRT